ncbi:MAG TPA: histidine kinase dimerization/phosphoacceptor domain -containing protein [Pararhizobium sp.]|nr:histidine kinase dimerization/phosphoacceptor domain -containing protein [Pararhizobium sp.]
MNAVVTSIRIERDTDVAYVRRAARIVSKSADAKPRDQARFATAVSEIARHALQYARNGVAEFSFAAVGSSVELVARVSDEGPGLSHPQSMPRPAGSAANGAGLGIAGSRKLVDHFEIASGSGGTVATLRLTLDPAGTATPSQRARQAKEALGVSVQFSPMEELAEQNRALREAFAQQEFLMRELHHRTKNNLALIVSLATLQARKVKSEEARQVLETLAQRVRAFSSAHSYLHRAEDVTRIDLKDHLDQLIGMLAKAFDEENISIVSQIENVKIDANHALELGLIVNELITNAAKHAIPGSGGRSVIRISVATRGERLRLTVADNGPGLEDAADVLRNSNSLGWRVVQASARKLDGSLTIDGSDGLSVTVEIDL